MFSLIFTNDSPSGKQVTVASPSGTPMLWQISSAKARFDEPEKILSFVSLMSLAWYRRSLLAGSLFWLFLQRVDPLEEVRQALVQDLQPAFRHVGDSGGAV